MDGKPKAHVTLVMPRSLYERLNEMRWEKARRVFYGVAARLAGRLRRAAREGA